MFNPTIVHYRIPLLDLKVSTNKFYAGTHWTKRKQIKDGILNNAVIFCRPVIKIESYPVEISYRFCFTTRALDTLNTAIMAKMFEDAFCTIGILADDDPTHVTRSILEVVANSRQKKQAKRTGQSEKNNKKDEDFVEITIKSN